jgi:FKBP-type peptidyl-prolyl cis-trans isomerase FklB
MKYPVIVMMVLSMVIGSLSLSAQKDKNKNKNPQKFELKSKKDSLSYCIGVAVMKNMKDQGIDSLNMDAMLQGFKDVFDSKTVVTPEAANQYVNDYFYKMYAKKSEKDKLKQTEWLNENKKKEGIKVTSSGLQYKVEKEGTGVKPTAASKVKVHYEGTLIDGTKFDSSYDRGEPIEFALNGVIKGWTEGLQLMTPGSIYYLYIPYELGYGEKGAGAQIPPYATLIFKVELLEVK